MPKKKPGMTPEKQSQAFRDEVQRLADAGELNPTEANAAFERMMAQIKTKRGDA